MSTPRFLLDEHMWGGLVDPGQETDMSVSVEFPEELLIACKEDRAEFTRLVMIYTLGHLYEQGKISSGLGAKVLGCDRWEFYRLLTQNGFAVIDYPADELSDEAKTSRQLASQTKKNS